MTAPKLPPERFMTVALSPAAEPGAQPEPGSSSAERCGVRLTAPYMLAGTVPLDTMLCAYVHAHGVCVCVWRGDWWHACSSPFFPPPCATITSACLHYSLPHISAPPSSCSVRYAAHVDMHLMSPSPESPPPPPSPVFRTRWVVGVRGQHSKESICLLSWLL